jgi:hypothetical protein
MIHLFPASGQASAFTIIALERFKKVIAGAERGFLAFGEWCRSSAFGEGASLRSRAVTEPNEAKSQKDRSIFVLPSNQTARL